MSILLLFSRLSHLLLLMARRVRNLVRKVRYARLFGLGDAVVTLVAAW